MCVHWKRRLGGSLPGTRLRPRSKTKHRQDIVIMKVATNDCPDGCDDTSIQANSLRPISNRRHFADDIFKCIFENENEWISPRISMKFVSNVRINNIPALVQIMAWRRPGDKPLSEPMMVSLLTHICVTRPQWVNGDLERVWFFSQNVKLEN